MLIFNLVVGRSGKNVFYIHPPLPLSFSLIFRLFSGMFLALLEALERNGNQSFQGAARRTNYHIH